jgi:hypothetical protein
MGWPKQPIHRVRFVWRSHPNLVGGRQMAGEDSCRGWNPGRAVGPSQGTSFLFDVKNQAQMRVLATRLDGSDPSARKLVRERFCFLVDDGVWFTARSSPHSPRCLCRRRAVGKLNPGWWQLPKIPCCPKFRTLLRENPPHSWYRSDSPAPYFQSRS